MFKRKKANWRYLYIAIFWSRRSWVLSALDVVLVEMASIESNHIGSNLISWERLRLTIECGCLTSGAGCRRAISVEIVNFFLHYHQVQPFLCFSIANYIWKANIDVCDDDGPMNENLWHVYTAKIRFWSEWKSGIMWNWCTADRKSQTKSFIFDIFRWSLSIWVKLVKRILRPLLYFPCAGISLISHCWRQWHIWCWRPLKKTDNQRFQGIPFKRLDDRHWRCTLPQDRSQGCQFVYISKQMRWFQQSMLFHISTFLNKSWKLNCFMIVMISGCCNSQWRSQGEIRSRRSGEFGLTRIRRIGSLLLKYLSRKILFEITYNYNQTKFR